MYKILLLIEKIFGYLQGKGYGSHTVENEVKLALSLLGHRPTVVFDIGANKGNWTKCLLDLYPGTRVYLFEPQTICADELKIKYSKLENVLVFEKAVGAKAEARTLFYDFEGSGLASLTLRKIDYAGFKLSNSMPVETISMDQFILEHSIGQIDLIKIDVEGHELEVFSGMHNLLNGNKRPKVIQFEFGGCNIDSRTFFKDFFELFSKDYLIYRQTPFGLDIISEYREADECFRTTNFFLKLK